MVHGKPSIHLSLIGLVGWVIFEALVGCHDILILGKSLIKWRQHPDMTMVVDWDAKHQFKQRKKTFNTETLNIFMFIKICDDQGNTPTSTCI